MKESGLFNLVWLIVTWFGFRKQIYQAQSLWQRMLGNYPGPEQANWSGYAELLQNWLIGTHWYYHWLSHIQLFDFIISPKAKAYRKCNLNQINKNIGLGYNRLNLMYYAQNVMIFFKIYENILT